MKFIKEKWMIILLVLLAGGLIVISAFDQPGLPSGNATISAGQNETILAQKLEPRLYGILKGMAPTDRVQVSIWLKVPRSAEEIEKEIAAKYTEANLDGTRPSRSTNMTLYEKIYGEMEESKKKANADTERPVIVYLTSRGINITYASMYAPVIYAQLSKKELLAVLEHENVSAVYLAIGRLPEKIVDKETIAINETSRANESIPTVEATGQRNDTVPAGINESNISQKFEWSPKFENRLYELLKGMSPGDKIQVSIWLKVPGGNRQDSTLEEKKKFYADVEKPVIDYLNSRDIKIQYASMFAPLIYAEISKKELFKLVQREDVSGIYSTIGYYIVREKPVGEKTTAKEEIIPMVEATGQVFDETAGILTRRWDARNFKGFWRDDETGASTEELVIDQSISSNRRVIEKHNLIYTTKQIDFNYQVYLRVNQTPAGTDGSYSAIGWLGEKYVYLQGNRIAKLIFEQNATDEKIITVGESWDLGEGWTFTAQSIDARAGVPQIWVLLFKDKNKLDDIILAPRYNNLYSYQINAEQINIPIFITYLTKLYPATYTDAAIFKYTWLRSQNITKINVGDTFGRMEVTSANNGTIELRNREPIVLTPGSTINLMGNISFQAANSTTGLLFYPHSTKKVRKD